MLIDSTGHWSEAFESAWKVASVVIAVIAAVSLVTTVSAFTGGIGTAASVAGASAFLGASLSGINGAVANDASGNSYFNGYVGGATGGAIQSGASALFSYGGTLVGGAIGVGVGTVVTDVLNNIDPYSSNSSCNQIANKAFISAAKGAVTSSLTAYMNLSVDSAVRYGTGGLMEEITVGFGESIKGFFGWLDDATVYAWE